MRRISRASTLTCIALASALCVTAPAFAAADYYLKFDGVDGETEKSSDKPRIAVIEVQAWSWGATQTATSGAGGGMGAGKVNVQDISATQPRKAKGEKGGTEDINIGVGELSGAAAANDRLRTAGPKDGWPAGAAEARKRPGKVKYGDITLKRGVSAGDVDGDGRADVAATEAGVVSPRDAASGLATGKRMHKPKMVPTMELGRSAPPSRAAGSLTTLVPAGMCRAGATYPSAELGTPGRVYRLEGVTVTDCSSAASSSGAPPMESISFNYTKIEW